MANLIRYVPGLIGAIIAFAALKFAIFLGTASTGWQMVVFFLTYIIITVAVDRAMTAYGTPAR
jgi:hypothetical protein